MCECVCVSMCVCVCVCVTVRTSVSFTAFSTRSRGLGSRSASSLSLLPFERAAHGTRTHNFSLFFSSFSPAFGFQPRGDLTHAASCGGRPVPLKTRDVSPSCSCRQESAHRDESHALPQERSTKASLHAADAKPSPSAAGFPSPHGN